MRVLPLMLLAMVLERADDLLDLGATDIGSWDRLLRVSFALVDG